MTSWRTSRRSSSTCAFRKRLDSSKKLRVCERFVVTLRAFVQSWPRSRSAIRPEDKDAKARFARHGGERQERQDGCRSRGTPFYAPLVQEDRAPLQEV